MKKNYTISVSASAFWKLLVPGAIVGAAIAAFGGIVIVDKVVMPHIVHVNRGMVTVPSIIEMPWEEARQQLFNIGLRLHIGSWQFDEKIPRDNIISQQPPAQESVRKQRLVIVSVSKGSEIGAVPNVIDMPERKATLELRKQGFIIGKIKRDYFDDHPKDALAAVVPKEGTTISKGMPLDVVVSDGPKPTHIDVPNVIGESLLSAKEKIEKAGLKMGKIDYKQNATVFPGTVISQSVPPASSVPLASSITIIVSVKN